MPALYHLGLLGAPSATQVEETERLVRESLAPFGLLLGEHVGWHIAAAEFMPDQKRAAAVAFFGGAGVPLERLDRLLGLSIPIIPVVSSLARLREEIPPALQGVNALAYDVSGAFRVASALLECAGLLPRQRRVFVSYRRDEARNAAIQVFESLSSRVFDVFLDTHGVVPGDEIQATIWHRLCDSDVLIMLDTPKYFESRWTEAEFGRALAKGISVLRVGWPDTTPSARTATASRVELLAEELDSATGTLSTTALDRIWFQVEALRSQSHAVRSINMLSNLRREVTRIGGTVVGVGMKSAIHLLLPGGREVIAYPSVGVPTSRALHDAATCAAGSAAAVIFDPIGLRREWLEHLDWLGGQIAAVRWLKATELAWDLAGWGL